MMNKCYVRDYLNMKECNDVIETLICDLWCIIDMVLFHYMWNWVGSDFLCRLYYVKVWMVCQGTCIQYYLTKV